MILNFCDNKINGKGNVSAMNTTNNTGHAKFVVKTEIIVKNI